MLYNIHTHIFSFQIKSLCVTVVTGRFFPQSRWWIVVMPYFWDSNYTHMSTLFTPLSLSAGREITPFPLILFHFISLSMSSKIFLIPLPMSALHILYLHLLFGGGSDCNTTWYTVQASKSRKCTLKLKNILLAMKKLRNKLFSHLDVWNVLLWKNCWLSKSEYQSSQFWILGAVDIWWRRSKEYYNLIYGFIPAFFWFCISCFHEIYLYIVANDLKANSQIMWTPNEKHINIYLLLCMCITHTNTYLSNCYHM